MTDIHRREFLARAAGSAAAFAIVPQVLGGTVWNHAESLRVGVVGAGRQGRAAVGELGKIEGVTVNAMCDTDERRLAAGLRRSSGATGYATLEAMLQSGTVDAVVLATPTHTHKDLALSTMGAGKHLYCECPLAHTREDCSAIAAAARSAGVVSAGGFQGRSNPVYTLARGFFRSDSVRDLVNVSAPRTREDHLAVNPANDPAREQGAQLAPRPRGHHRPGRRTGAPTSSTPFQLVHRPLPQSRSARGVIRATRTAARSPTRSAPCSEFEDGAVAAVRRDAGQLLRAGGTRSSTAPTPPSSSPRATAGCSRRPTRPPRAGRSTPTASSSTTTRASRSSPAPPSSPSRASSRRASACRTRPLYYALADWVKAIGSGGTPACTISEAARATVVGIAANDAVRTAKPVDIDLSGL
jgi:hypothetical protein